MKELMKSNIYDVDETIIVVGSCLKNIQPNGYEKLQRISNNIYELCLEETHINMAITKIGGMLRTNKIKKIIFASVDKSPHCIGLHYIQDELRKMMNLENIEIENYVIVNNELIKISPQIITLSKNLKELSNLKNRVGDNNE
jgi:hypothetical protein